MKTYNIIIYLLVLVAVGAGAVYALSPTVSSKEEIAEADRAEEEIKTAIILLKEEKRRLMEEALRQPRQRSIESRPLDPEKLANMVSYIDAPFPIDKIMASFRVPTQPAGVTTFALIVNRLVLGVIIMFGLAGVVLMLAGRKRT